MVRRRRRFCVFFWQKGKSKWSLWTGPCKITFHLFLSHLRVRFAVPPHIIHSFMLWETDFSGKTKERKMRSTFSLQVQLVCSQLAFVCVWTNIMCSYFLGNLELEQTKCLPTAELSKLNNILGEKSCVHTKGRWKSDKEKKRIGPLIVAIMWEQKDDTIILVVVMMMRTSVKEDTWATALKPWHDLRTQDYFFLLLGSL